MFLLKFKGSILNFFFRKFKKKNYSEVLVTFNHKPFVCLKKWHDDNIRILNIIFSEENNSYLIELHNIRKKIIIIFQK